MSVSYQPNGEEYRRFTLMDRKQMKSTQVYPDKVKILPSILEKIVMVKLRRGSFDDTELGMWIGTRHLVVYLTKDEYETTRSAANEYTGKQRQKKSADDFE